MIRYIIKKIKHFNKIEVNLDKISSNLQEIRNRSSTLAIYGSPTGASYLGIANATRNLYPHNSLEIPQYYSNTQLTKKQFNYLITAINNLKFENVILSGFAPYFFDIADNIYTNTSVIAFYHGTISELHSDENRKFITNLVSRTRKGIFSEISFVCKNLDITFNKLFKIKTSHQPLKIEVEMSNFNKIDLDESKIHIGIFGSDTFNKNLHNQVIHSLLFDNVIVHVLDKSVFDYLEMPDRIIEHGTNLHRAEFLSILGSMDLNLYMSYNESFGLLSFESEVLTVPCLRMNTVDYRNLISLEIEKLLFNK
jgi:glycosyltransferase involved in cell wall biosynthesis